MKSLQDPGHSGRGLLKTDENAAVAAFFGFICKIMLSRNNHRRKCRGAAWMLFPATLFALFSCSKPMQTMILEKQEPFSKDHPTQFSFKPQDLPRGSVPVAVFRTNTFDNSVYCRFDELIELAQKESAALGGDFILIDRHDKPNAQNSCHNFKATLYRTLQPGETPLRPPPSHTPSADQKGKKQSSEKAKEASEDAPAPAVTDTTELLPEEKEVQAEREAKATYARSAKPDEEAVSAADETPPAVEASEPTVEKEADDPTGATGSSAEESIDVQPEPARKPALKTKVWDDATEAAYLARKTGRSEGEPRRDPSAKDSENSSEGGTASDGTKEEPEVRSAPESSGPPPGGGYFGYRPEPQTEENTVREKGAKEIIERNAPSPIGFMSLYGGFARRLAPLPDGLPGPLETFLDETRKGHVFGVDLVFRVAPNNYLGIQFDRLSSRHSEVFLVNNGNTVAQGTWEENTGVSFVGLTYNITTVAGPTGTHFFMGVSAGAALYNNRGRMPYEIDDEPVFVPFSLSGNTVSLGLNGGVNIAMADNLFLRVGGNLFTGVLTEVKGEINGNSITLEFESGEGEGLVRGSLFAGISLAF